MKKAQMCLSHVVLKRWASLLQILRNDLDLHSQTQELKPNVKKLENCQKLGSASRLAGVAMQEKLSFIHNGIEHTSTVIKNFIDIQNRFCFI